MELRAFACVIGLSVFVAQCIVRYALAKQAAKAETALESVLTDEFRRLENELVRMTALAASLGEQEPAKRLDTVPEQQSAEESRLDVGRLIEAERDAHRAQRGLHQLHAHNLALLTSLDASAAPPSKTQMLLVQGLLFLVGIGAGGLAMNLFAG